MIIRHKTAIVLKKVVNYVKYDLRTGFFSAQTTTSTSSGNPSTTQFQVPIFAIIFFLNTF